MTDDGVVALGELGVDVPALQRLRRPLTRACLDWTERRHHLAGALGAAIASRLRARGWIEHGAEGRIVRVTPAGKRGLRSWVGVEA